VATALLVAARTRGNVFRENKVADLGARTKVRGKLKRGLLDSVALR
jgi:hypothetical protein